MDAGSASVRSRSTTTASGSRNDERFDLPLAPHSDPDPLPPWLRLGFRLASAADVRAAYDAIDPAGISVRERLTEDDLVVFFRCPDPDGHLLEIYRE